MAVLVGVHLAVVHARRAQLGLGQAGAAGGHVEHLDHRRALGAPVAADILAAGDRAGGDPAFPVGRAGQHRQHGLAGQQVRGLHRVAGREDVRGRGAHLRVDHDPAARPDLDAGVPGQAHAGTRPGRHHYHVSLERRAVGQIDHQPAAVPAANCGGGGAEPQVHFVGADVVVQDPGHLRVQPRHQPLGPLHHGGRQPPGPERLGELQPDVTAADDDRARGALVQLGDDAVHVGDVAQHVDPRVVGTGDRRPDRFGPQAQHQLVVGLPVRPLLREIAHLDFPGVAVDAEHVLPGPHIQRQALGEAFRVARAWSTTASEYAVSVSSTGQAASRTGSPGSRPQRRGDRDAGPGRQGDQAGRVAADDHHACLGGEGQPVPAAPAQRAGDRPVGDAAGAVDVGEPVHHVPAKRRRVRGRDRERQGPGNGRRAGGQGRGRTGDDRGDQRAGHGCLPRREAGLISAVGRRGISRAVRVFKRCSEKGDVPPLWVSEGGLEPPDR